ncbi:MAG: exonuclease domain-containing protein, partial [Clostridia bacterium]|nr:exonuclease domain-containing protein [Clostridia bacterium]
LKEGDAIIASGRMGEYNGSPSFTIERINGCEFPDDFVKQEKFKKKAPEYYKTVFPSPAETVKVTSVFEKESPLPEYFLNNEYVVFDLETTGTELSSCEITEFGAVRIKNGKMVEQFTSLVKPDGVIPERITELTGIDDELVKDAPKIVSVLPDFLKFIKGATVVAHNADFDVGFIKKYAAANDYEFNNPVEDTLALSRKYIHGLKHYDLHTLAEHFNISFRHHRALSDAYATAEILIEIMKIAYAQENSQS